MKKQKHYFQGQLKPISNVGSHIGPIGLVVEEQEGKRLTTIAEDLLFQEVPEKEHSNYIPQLQHIGLVNREG